jgi:hypothetical protein
MSRVPYFYSINEGMKPKADRVYHNNNTCPPGLDIPKNERRRGKNEYRPCKDCAGRD